MGSPKINISSETIEMLSGMAQEVLESQSHDHEGEPIASLCAEVNIEINGKIESVEICVYE